MSTTTDYVMEEWEKPKPLPSSGVAIPTTSKNEFYHYFMNVDDRIWEMTQAQRETWKNEILNNWDTYRLILYMDGTGAFHQQLKDMNRMGGALILVAGDMGTGKSVFAMSCTKIWNVLNKNPNPIHIFWSKNEVRAKIRKTAGDTAHIIDEDMKATGSGSANLEIHLKNLFESIRKTGKLVLYVGVNAQPSRLGRAIGLQIFPIGFNRRFQANRFIVCNWKGEPLWIAYTQRFYFPTEKAYFEGDLGYLGEYGDRALEFSNNMTGIFSGSNAEQEKEWGTHLVKHCQKEWKDIKLSMEMLEYEAIQIGIPQESVASIRRVCAFTKFTLRKNKLTGDGGSGDVEIPRVFSDEWDKLRQMIKKYHVNNGTKEDQADGISKYIVPKTPTRSQTLVAEDVGTTEGALGKWYSRRQTDKIMPPANQGTIGEKFAQSLVSIGGAKWDCSTGEPDLLLGDCAVNIKLTFSSGTKAEPMKCSPEHNWDNSWLLVFYPRFLDIRLFKIGALDDRHRMVVARLGGIPVTFETLNEQLEEISLMLVKENDEDKGGDIK